jgi:hypothetical protein
MEQQAGKDKVTKFLSLLTLKAAADFEKLHKIKDERSQLLKTNVFVNKPFLFFRNEYKFPYNPVFVQTMQYFVYNF